MRLVRQGVNDDDVPYETSEIYIEPFTLGYGVFAQPYYVAERKMIRLAVYSTLEKALKATRIMRSRYKRGTVIFQFPAEEELGE